MMVLNRRPRYWRCRDAGMAVDRNILPVLNRNYSKGRMCLCTPGTSVPLTQSVPRARDDDEGAR